MLAASPVRALLRPAFWKVPVHVMSTDEVRAMATRYGEVAAWAREAGYDGIQLGSANAKLLDQFLSPFYNRRTDEFGGSLENRARILHLIRDAVAERAGADYPCLVKVPVEQAPPGFPHATHDEALRLSTLVEEWGFDAVTPGRGVGVPRHDAVTRRRARRVLDEQGHGRTLARGGAVAAGGAPSSRAARGSARRRAPFAPVWNRELFAAVKRRVGIPVLAVGGIRTATEVRDILDRGDADLVGIGRPFYAEPDLAARILADGAGPGPVPQLQPLRRRADARHEGRLLQPRGPPHPDALRPSAGGQPTHHMGGLGSRSTATGDDSARWMARQTRSGVNGMSRCTTP